MKEPPATVDSVPVEAGLSLREQAEKKVREAPQEILTDENGELLLHELRVHQVELQMQNEELRRIQHDLELSRSRYFDLYDLAPVGYLTLTPSGLIREVNLTAAALLGLSKTELLKRPFSRCIFPPDQDIYYLSRKQQSDDSTSQMCELRLLRAGNPVPFWAHLQAVPADDGEYRITLIDISDRKQAEEALAVKTQQIEALNQSLEIRIAEAVQELRLKDELLIQQGRLAAMGEMINNIAHQWRQPLNNIGLIVQNLQLSFKTGTITTASMNKDIGNTMQLLQQMSGTIDDFRNFFSQEKVLQAFTVNEAIQRSLNFMLPALKCSGISIQCEEQPDVTAEGYPGEYTQAVLNILTNAKDVLLERNVAAPRITIRIFSENNRSVVTVTDNGGGIPLDALPKIFDPYFTTKQKGTGTGIGLFMSKLIIEKNMQGCLKAYNAEGGAEFRVEL